MPIHHDRPAARRARSAAAALLLSALAAPFSLAVDARDNAALKYWQAWAQITPQTNEALSDLDMSAIAGPEWKTPDAIIQCGVLQEEFIARLRRAATLKEADFGIEFDQWPSTLLPHLAPLRRSAQILAIHARQAIDAGDHADAAASIAAAYRMAHHATTDGTLIGALVGVAIFQMTDRVAAFGADARAFTDADKALLLDAINTFDSPDDPFRLVEALIVERELIAQWIRSVVAGAAKPDALDRVIAAIEPLIPEAEAREKIRASFAENPDFESHVALFRVYYDNVLAAWDAPDAREKLTELENGTGAGAFGAIVQVMSPAILRLHDRETQSRELIATARARLKD